MAARKLGTRQLRVLREIAQYGGQDTMELAFGPRATETVYDALRDRGFIVMRGSIFRQRFEITAAGREALAKETEHHG